MTDQTPSGNAVAAVAVVVALVAFVAGFGAISNGITNFDDLWQVRDNPLVTAPLTLHKISAVLASGYHGEYQPVKLFSYMADNVLYGALGVDVIRGMHLTNVAIHCLNASLVALLAMAVAGDLAREKFGTSGLLAVGLLSGLYFALHPIHVEAVAWLSGRKDLLAFFFLMLAFFAFRSHAASAGVRNGAATVTFFALALASKSTAAALPLLAGAYWLLAGRAGGRRAAVLLAALAAMSVAAVSIATSVAATGGYMASPVGGSRWVQFLTAVKTFPFYMRLLLFPVGLSAVYRLRAATGLLDITVWWGALMLAAQLAVAAFARPKMARFIVLWYIIALLPVLQFVPTMSVPALAADRYAYLASVPFALAPAVIVWRVRAKLLARGAIGMASALMAAAVLYAGVLGVATWSRNRVWQSSETLWSDVLSKYPRTTMALVNLGQARFEKSDHAGARALFTEASRVNPGYILAYTNLAMTHEAQGDLASAKAMYTLARVTESTLSGRYTAEQHAVAAFGLARIYYQEGDYLRALQAAEIAYWGFPALPRLEPFRAQATARVAAMTSFANDMLAEGDLVVETDPDRAERFYRRAGEVLPGYHLPRERLARFLYRRARWEEAFGEFVVAASLGADGAEFYYEYGVAALRIDRSQAAAECLARALNLDPFMTKAKISLAIARARLGEPWQAQRILKEILEKDPGNREARQVFNAITAAINERVRSRTDAAR